MAFENQITTKLFCLLAMRQLLLHHQDQSGWSLHHYNALVFQYSFKKDSVLEEEMHQPGDHNLGEHQHFWFNKLHTRTYFCMELLMTLSTQTVLSWHCIVSAQIQNKKDF